MEKKIISEEEIQKKIEDILSEQMSKVSRQDFNRVQFKIEELQNSLNETIKEFRKLDDSIPNGLKTITKGRLFTISSGLMNSQKMLSDMKDKVRQYKRKLYQQQVDDKNKPV